MAASVSMQGETIQAVISNATISNTSSNGFSLFDANGVARTLQPYERLVIDNITVASLTASAFVITILAAAAGASSVTAATTLAALYGAENAFLDVSTKEGINVPLGVTPSALASSALASTTITMSCRIITGGTQGARPNWRESLASHAI